MFSGKSFGKYVQTIMLYQLKNFYWFPKYAPRGGEVLIIAQNVWNKKVVCLCFFPASGGLSKIKSYYIFIFSLVGSDKLRWL